MLTKPFYGRKFFEADSGSNAGGNKDENPAGKDAQPGGQQGEPEGFNAITSEEQLREWKTTTRNHLISEIKADLKKDQEQRDAAAKADADRKAAEDRGAFDEVKHSLTKERDDAKAATDALTETVTAYATIVADQVEAMKGELPDELLTEFPAEGTPLEQLTWLKRQKQVYDVALTAAGKTADGTNVVKLPVTPKPNGNKLDGLTKEQQEAINRQYRRF